MSRLYLPRSSCLVQKCFWRIVIIFTFSVVIEKDSHIKASIIIKQVNYYTPKDILYVSKSRYFNYSLIVFDWMNTTF